jgi:vacuolar-type H+-ATPase subunit I/STV1
VRGGFLQRAGAWGVGACYEVVQRRMSGEHREGCPMKDAKKSGGIKSALELAMERMQQKQGDVVPLTHDQKLAIAEIEAETTAKVAEEEIMSKERLRAAYASGDAEAARKVDEEIRGEIARLRERGESRKQKVRRGE